MCKKIEKTIKQALENFFYFNIEGQLKEYPPIVSEELFCSEELVCGE